MKLPIVQVPVQLADFVEEVLEDLLAAGRVGDFGVELHAVERLVAMPHGGEGAGGRGGQRDEIAGQVVNLIAVAHPDGRFLREPAHERIILDDGELRAAEFAALAGLTLPPSSGTPSCMP